MIVIQIGKLESVNYCKECGGKIVDYTSRETKYGQVVRVRYICENDHVTPYPINREQALQVQRGNQVTSSKL